MFNRSLGVETGVTTHGLVFTQIITGLSIGGQLFLLAVGLSLIFGVLDVLNFTHGVLYMLGAYAVVVVTKVTGNAVGSFWIGLVVGAVGVGLVGAAIEAGFIRRTYGRDPLDQLLLTFGFVLILGDVTLFFFGTGSHIVRPPKSLDFTIGLTSSLSIPAYRAFVILMSILVLGIIFAVLRTTNIGRLVRATSSDRDMAALLGVDVPKLYTLVFFVGTALAAIGGGLAAPVVSVKPTLGDQVIIKAFVIAVIGGLGSFGGAFVGAYLVGLSIAVGSIIVAGAGDLLPFLAMIIVLLVKPEGLFGEAQT